ncbi:hypothetical protein [Luteibacter yeojuensis]|uniref:hypothetical protein n=1 Tax=Luteibacter yeojuensis TaxID=345309 RepID=UPI000A077270|nr:hypothetical protein [Luteibacter yeojuensis]
MIDERQGRVSPFRASHGLGTNNLYVADSQARLVSSGIFAVVQPASDFKFVKEELNDIRTLVGIVIVHDYLAVSSKKVLDPKSLY